MAATVGAGLIFGVNPGFAELHVAFIDGQGNPAAGTITFPFLSGTDPVQVGGELVATNLPAGAPVAFQWSTSAGASGTGVTPPLPDSLSGQAIPLVISVP